MLVAVAALGPAVLGLGPALLLTGAAVGGQAWVRRRARERRARAVELAVPDLVDLFVIAAAAGHTVPGCLRAVAGRAPPATRPALADACARLDRGSSVVEALTVAGTELGATGATLTEALANGHRTGAPLGATLGQVVETARGERRRRAEEAARRLPVTLLFPLVCCVLPAFALLAVVPLLAASLGSLRT